MHDMNSKNVSDDPVQIPDQLDEVVPLTPVQIFVKEEESIHDELDEVVPLTPVQIYVKEEESVSYKAEEPVLVSLLPVLPKDEHLADEIPDDFEEGSGPLIINLENSSSEEWSNHSDPLAVEPNVANESYVEYVETSDPILMDLGAASTEGSSHPLRITQEATSIVENGELYDLVGSGKVVELSENDGVLPDEDTDGECVQITAVPLVPAKTFHCGYCRESFFTEGEMQMHTLMHTSYTVVRREVPEFTQKPKPVRTLRAQHTCGDCGESFDRLDYLMRHRLSHIRATLRKPFSMPKQFNLLKSPGVPKQSTVPQPLVTTTSDSRRTVAGASTRTLPKRGTRRSATTPQQKKWARRKKTRRRWVS